ncbi:hypothetical protein VNO80_30332 [Phaseolus coccineus]|uniref:PGG domain-containing protein n=1 Tax=Phaseolus coccineus TaxID=3886 RepID=A0AAN9QFQ3_PHACN
MLTQLNASNLGIPVEDLDVEEAIKSYMEKVEKEDDHEHRAFKCLSLSGLGFTAQVDIENKGKKAQIFVEQKYVTSVRFVKSVVRFAFKCQCLRLSIWGVNTALVKNKQTNVVEKLRENLNKELFDSLILEVDDRENTALHLAAAGTSINERIWQRAGTTMQMIRDIKWYEYISGLVPEEFNYRRNKDGETAWEIYERKHMQKVKDSSDALKDLSNSASVVTALIAGVSFATSGSLPGSTKDGKPIYSDQPAFDVFSIAVLFGLGFSITALVMFLAILTSSKQAQDFRLSLPLKLIFGLGSLFASVASMLLSFWAAYFFVLNEKYKIIIFPVCFVTCLPLTIYAVMQFPFYVDLVRVISSKAPLPFRTHHPFIAPTSR